MAAKPPKPPGSFLKCLLNQHNNNKNQIQLQQQQQQNNEHDDNKEGCSNLQNTTTVTNSTIAITTTNPADSNLTTQSDDNKTSNCNCSNISIMHLFHEMKQEFPTLPDTIVAQCVNENCHQRENCIQMLKHELELNPVPAQSYPAKVLHPPNSLNNLQNSTTTAAGTIQKPPLQQKPLIVQQKPPLKPIKPIRTAPLQPPTQQQQQLQTNGKLNCTKINSTLNKNANKPLSGEKHKNNEEFIGNGCGEGSNDRLINAAIPLKQSIQTNTSTNSTTTTELCREDNVSDENIEKNIPRQRPTTLNLNTQLQKQQQQQRQRLNIQLQQRFQEQRNRQQLQNNSTTTITKPLRKAPLPPIAPKPSQLVTHQTNTNDSLHTNTTSPLTESDISVSVSLSTTPSPTSSLSPNTTTHHHQHSLNKTTHTPTTNQQHLQTKSPVRHRSVITLQPEPPYTRDFLFTPNSSTYTNSSIPTVTSPSLAAPKTASSANSSSSTSSSPTASVAGSQKSFTSVNLTLRPPVSPNAANSALQPSTIDITAGPGFSGASGGGKSLHYSSTSYDARLGYQQNFQITVTDECGVFTASRIRPQQQQQQRCLNQVNIKNDNSNAGSLEKDLITNNNSFSNAQKQQQLQLQQQQQFHNNNVVALQQNIQNSIQSPQGGGNTSTTFGSGGGGGGGGTSPYISGNMCLPPQQAMDATTQEILQRQKKKRDKLAAALREYKKRLGNVEQEINLLTGTIPTEGLSERLDEEITKLRRDCQDMLRSSNTFTQPALQQELAINHQPQQAMYQQPPQPFPRQQRITRPPQRSAPPRQTSLDIIQHHSQTSSPHTPPAASLPNLNLYSPLQLQQLQQSNHSMLPYYHQQSAPVNNNFVNNNEVLYTDQSAFYDDPDHVVEDDADEYDEYEEVIEQPWECNMCTFRNHPQLNICETCENVRIIPGRLTNLSRALSASNCTNASATASPSLGLLRGSSSHNAINNSSNSSRNGLNAANGNLEHDTNLAQQQLQHFALHT